MCHVSTIDQNPNARCFALKVAGCEAIVTEKVSGVAVKRPKFDKLLRSLNAGDVLTVWRLDRVERSLIVERTQAGLVAAKKRGHVWGGFLRFQRHK